MVRDLALALALGLVCWAVLAVVVVAAILGGVVILAVVVLVALGLVMAWLTRGAPK